MGRATALGVGAVSAGPTCVTTAGSLPLRTRSKCRGANGQGAQQAGGYWKGRRKGESTPQRMCCLLLPFAQSSLLMRRTLSSTPAGAQAVNSPNFFPPGHQLRHELRCLLPRRLEHSLRHAAAIGEGSLHAIAHPGLNQGFAGVCLLQELAHLGRGPGEQQRRPRASSGRAVVSWATEPQRPAA